MKVNHIERSGELSEEIYLQEKNFVLLISEN